MFLRVLMIGSLFLVVISGVLAQDDEEATPEVEEVVPPLTVRAVWEQDVFVLINISTEGVDLTNLRLESELGEISPSDWQMQLNPRNAVPFRLNNVRPGSCLVAYFVGEDGAPPENVECTRIIGIYVITTIEDIVWSIGQGGFNATVGETVSGECSIGVSSCDIGVFPSNTVQTTTEEIETDAITIRAIWSPDIWVLINNSGNTVDVSTLEFTSEVGGVTPDDWVMDFAAELDDFYSLERFNPGECLLAYIGPDRPEFPETVECSQVVGRFILEDVESVFWTATQEGFLPSIDGQEVEFCPTDRSNCDIVLTEDQIVEDEASDEEDEAEDTGEADEEDTETDGE